MDKNMLAAIGVTIALLGGGLFFLQTSNSDDPQPNETANSDQQAEQSQEEDQLGANPLGLDQASSKGPYQIAISTTGPNGDSSATVSVDGAQNTESTITQNDQETSFIAFEGDVYLQTANEGWVRIPSGSNSPLSTDEINSGFNISAQDELQDVTVSGTGACSTGTCRLYQITDSDGSKGTVKVDQQTDRLSDVEIESKDGETVTMRYSYDVTVQINPPADFSDFNF